MAAVQLVPGRSAVFYAPSEALAAGLSWKRELFVQLSASVLADCSMRADGTW